MRKESNNNYILNIIELHPDSDYIEKKEAESGNSTKDIRTLIKNEDFTGYFLVYSYETNKLIFGERRENGIPTTRLQQ
ncbi:hypothetical protein [Flavobacterium sp. LM4]|uniref:hypothetical protein n=1 Tax=Flavobacterium sp. LM4 TaxID=1938609 RepID=UPI00099375FD|nr:hypothetical protein [Flavobacterium sp. LM4]OOV19829.1 hypothetical protein BXU10_09405 [Flavobacterium sp. LM4]